MNILRKESCPVQLKNIYGATVTQLSQQNILDRWTERRGCSSVFKGFVAWNCTPFGSSLELISAWKFRIKLF
jgi:hypothetical protein